MDRVYTNWADAYGNTRLTWYSYRTGADLPPFSTALSACCNPVVVNAVAGELQTFGSVPSTNPYALVQDSAVLQFGTGVGSLVGVIAPGFREALYLADNQTVDPAQPLVAALIAAVIALPLVDGAGNPATTYIGGLRQKRGY